MTPKRYKDILSYLHEATDTTPLWEGKLFAVGGCVRDALMGREVKDIDICVALPHGGEKFALWLQRQGLAIDGSVGIFKQFGTAKLRLAAFPDEELEFVQTRRESYPDRESRNPMTGFGTMEEDCLRRDLTVNALYRDIASGEIVDLCGRGIADIRSRRIRTVRNPRLVFDEDPLRILRCIRFTSRFGQDWTIDPETFAAMREFSPRLEILTQDRIRDELFGMLSDDDPVRAMELLRETGAMHYVIGELEASYDMTQNHCHWGTVWQHTMAVLQYFQDNRSRKPGELADNDLLTMRIAALLHDIGKPSTRTMDPAAESSGIPAVHFHGHAEEGADIAEKILKKWHCPPVMCEEIKFLIAMHMVFKKTGDNAEKLEDSQLRKLQYQCGSKERFEKLLSLIDADNLAHAEGYRHPGQVPAIIRRTDEMISDGTDMFGYNLPVTGKEIMDILGIGPGPEIKLILDKCLEEAFKNPMTTLNGFASFIRLDICV